MSKRTARLKQDPDEEEGHEEQKNNGDSDELRNSKKADDALIQSLIERVGASSSKVDPVWLSHLLDASSGNLDLAASYFWDNYILQAQQQETSSKSRKKKKKKRMKGEPDEDDIPLRRRLESRFESVKNHEENDGNHRDEEEEHDDDGGDGIVMNNSNNDNAVHHRRQVNNNHHDSDNDNDDIMMRNDNEEEEDEIHQEIANDHDHNDGHDNMQHDISASVSDDEGGIWRITRMERNYVGLKPPGASSRPKISREQDKKNDDENNSHHDSKMIDDSLFDDNELYLSDNDWLFQPSSYTDHIDNKTPLDILWGSPEAVPKPLSSSDGNNNDSDSNQRQEEKDKGPSNVLDFDVDDDDDDSGTRHQQDDDRSSRIPSTWLNAGFFMCPEEGNLLLKPPSDEDVALYRWRQSQESNNSNQSQLILPPHYCKSVTALLSIVQATMLSGTSIQGGILSDPSSNQKPWGELCAEERKKHFEKRLVQALSAILFLAWKTAKSRKEKALETTKKRKRHQSGSRSNSDDNPLSVSPLRCIFQKRLQQLCPTCGWEVDSTTGESRLPETPSSREVILTSFTNIHDITSYVGSHLRTFMAKGGCVLFLETLIRIHGANAIRRQINRNKSSRKENSKVEQSLSSCLIHCTCEARQTKMSPAKTGYRNAGNGNKNVVLDTTPPGHDCISLELLSLILTGEVHSNWNQDWSIDPSLGFGLLSRNPTEHVISSSLSNNSALPKSRVWLLRGDTCHSVAWITSNTYENSDVMKVSHWNPWFGLSHNLTHFRLVKGRERWKPPVLSKFLHNSVPKKEKTTVVDRIWQQRQREKESEIKLKAERNAIAKENDMCDKSTNDDIKGSKGQSTASKVVIHPEDKTFYPDNYRCWRYQFPATSSEECSWISFANLNSSQREMVEWQMAPSIHFVFWNSGYKKAVLDQFQPAPPVV